MALNRLPLAFILFACSVPTFAGDDNDLPATYTKCINDVDGQGAGAFDVCASKEIAKLDKALNEKYKILLKTKRDRMFFVDNLRASERAWLVYSEKSCEAEGNLWGGASIAEERGSCSIRLMQDRIKWLQRLADEPR